MLTRFKTLYKKEILRFLKVYNQTLITPIINSLLFLTIFTLAFGEKITLINGISYAEFIAPGLIAMMMVQNSFANSSSSLITSKVLGFITDLLIPPIGEKNIIFAIALAALTRGIIVGTLGFITMSFFVNIEIHNIYTLIIYTTLINSTLALIGLLCGLYANTFDQTTVISSYIITPLSFLSGTFYSINQLPIFWYNLSKINPFFYMIDGMRFSLTGYSDGNIYTGIYYLITLNIIFFYISLIWLKNGWRIKQ